MTRNNIKKEDFIIVIESLNYELNRKPNVMEIADRLNIKASSAFYYIKLFDLGEMILFGKKGRPKGSKKVNVPTLETEITELKEMTSKLLEIIQKIDENMMNKIQQELNQKS